MRLQSARRWKSSWKCVRAPCTGPKCVRKSVSGSQDRMRSALERHASRSTSGGGVGGMHVRAPDSPDAGGVANERDAARRVEVADVMRRVAGRVRDLQLAAAPRNRLAAGEHADARPGPGRNSPHSRSMSPRTAAWRSQAASRDRSCAARRARARRPRCRILAHERARRAGVIEVDVGEQQLPHVAERDAFRGKRALSARQACSTDQDRSSATPEGPCRTAVAMIPGRPRK